jgi:hypothetical protein
MINKGQDVNILTVSTDVTKVYKMCIGCFSAKYAALRRKSKDWLGWNQDNVSKWGNMSTHRLFVSVS